MNDAVDESEQKGADQAGIGAEHVAADGEEDTDRGRSRAADMLRLIGGRRPVRRPLAPRARKMTRLSEATSATIRLSAIHGRTRY